MRHLENVCITYAGTNFCYFTSVVCWGKANKNGMTYYKNLNKFMCDTVYIFPLIKSLNLAENDVTQSIRIHFLTLFSIPYVYKYFSD